jgi:hypothetical protein
MAKHTVRDNSGTLILPYCGSRICRDAIATCNSQPNFEKTEAMKLLKECYWEVGDEMKQKIKEYIEAKNEPS